MKQIINIVQHYIWSLTDHWLGYLIKKKKKIEEENTLIDVRESEICLLQ